MKNIEYELSYYLRDTVWYPVVIQTEKQSIEKIMNKVQGKVWNEVADQVGVKVVAPVRFQLTNQITYEKY